MQFYFLLVMATTKKKFPFVISLSKGSLTPDPLIPLLTNYYMTAHGTRQCNRLHLVYSVHANQQITLQSVVNLFFGGGISLSLTGSATLLEN